MEHIEPEPIHRTTARVLPVDRRGRVLLLHGHDPARPEAPYWFTIGGGCEPGEGTAQTALRELREETGIRLGPDALAEPFHHGRHDYTYDGRRYAAHSTFFAVALDDVEVDITGIETGETITGWGWWHPDEVEHLALSNRHLPDIARRAVAHLRSG